MDGPKMILFDCGNALRYKPGFYPLGGEETLLPYVARNSRNLTSRQERVRFEKLFRQMRTQALKLNAEDGV